MPPQVTPSEKKIWIQASAQTWTWRTLKSLVLSSTHIDLQQFLPLGGEVEGDPVHVAGKGGCTHQEDDEDAVGEEGGEVDQLAEGLDPLPQGAVDDCPSQEQAKSKLPTNGAKVVNSLGDIQHEVAAKRHF